MKSLLLLSILAALAVAALCYESHESLESYEIRETLTALYHHNRDGERKPKRESENSTSLNTSSTGKLVMTSNFANAMPWCTDTTLPTTVISGSAEGPNETGQKSLSRAWCLVLYSLAVALLNYIETYESLNCSLNVLVWLHPSFLPTG